MEWILVKTVFSLLLVLVLMAGVLYAVKKFANGGSRFSGNSIAIDILSSRSLQPKQSMAVVRVFDRVLVVGISDNGIALLTELDNELVSAYLEQQAKQATDSVPGRFNLSFAQHLGRQLQASMLKGVNRGPKA